MSVLDSPLDLTSHDARRAAEGGSGCFRPPNVITVNPYAVCVHVGAGEASVVNMGVLPSSLSWSSIGDGLEAQVDADGEIIRTRSALSDIEKAFKNLAANNARARSKFRRYFKRNRLRKMWVLTYEDQTVDRRQVKSDVNGLMVRWRDFKGGEKFPYAYVLEYHDSGFLHVHIAVPKGFFEKATLQKLWGHGLVWFEDRKAPKGTSGRKQSEILASYLAKYLDKSFTDDAREFGEHRYEVAQGFDPEQVRREFPTLEAARVFLAEYEGEAFKLCWQSSDKEEWDGRPVWLFSSA